MNNRITWDQIKKWRLRVDCGEWIWARNTPCKYVNFHVDSRNPNIFYVGDRDKNPITPDQLFWQYSKETPKRPKT